MECLTEWKPANPDLHHFIEYAVVGDWQGGVALRECSVLTKLEQGEIVVCLANSVHDGDGNHGDLAALYPAKKKSVRSGRRQFVEGLNGTVFDGLPHAL